MRETWQVCFIRCSGVNLRIDSGTFLNVIQFTEDVENDIVLSQCGTDSVEYNQAYM